MKSVYVYDTKYVDGEIVPVEWLSFHKSISEAAKIYEYSPSLISYHFIKNGRCLVDTQDATVIMFPVYKPEYDNPQTVTPIEREVKWYQRVFALFRKNK